MKKKTEPEEPIIHPVLFDVGTPKPLPPIEEDFEEPVKEIDETAPLPFKALTGARFSPCKLYRYNLWRRRLETGKTILWIALNPSTADEVVNDPTVQRMENFSWAWGYALCIVANAFAFRATDPKVMRKQADPIGPENDEWILKMRKQADLTIVAWGNHGRFRNRGQELLEKLKPLGPLYCLGVTKEQKTKKFIRPGCPKHPLYLRADLKPVLFQE